MPSAIAIAAHPDDIEFLMSGTLMLLRKAKYQIHYWNLANGCCGSSKHDAQTIARMRRDEAYAAATAIGATFHESICNDLEIFYDRPTLAKVAAVIREVAPEIVLTHSPVDYMEDHTNTCRLAVTAAFSRGMPNFSTDPPRPAVNGPVTVYHAQPYSHRDPLGNIVEPALVVDTTDLIELKKKMLAKHVSQKEWLDESQGVNSYLDAMAALDAEVGRMSCIFKYAEGWRRHLHMGFCGPEDDPLRTALKSRVLVAAKEASE
jgi:LmbE family N-acetylglucosaminyl deacetylase